MMTGVNPVSPRAFLDGFSIMTQDVSDGFATLSASRFDWKKNKGILFLMDYYIPFTYIFSNHFIHRKSLL